MNRSRLILNNGTPYNLFSYDIKYVQCFLVGFTPLKQRNRIYLCTYSLVSACSSHRSIQLNVWSECMITHEHLCGRHTLHVFVSFLQTE